MISKEPFFWLGLVYSFLMTTAGCEPSAKSISGGSNENIRYVLQGDDQREYVLHVPISATSETALPLLINFHGFGDLATDHAETVGEFYGLNELADSNKFLVAYPQGVVRSKEGAEWDPGDNEESNIMTNDIFFVEKLIESISQDYSIDSSRIYAVGYSNGGMMAYGLACSNRNLVAAIGVMSGVLLEGYCESPGITPVIHFHGLADDVLPYEGNEYFQPVPEVMKNWVSGDNDGNFLFQEKDFNDGLVTRYEYAREEDGTSLAVLYAISQEHNKPGGHVWFSDKIGSEHPNQILWDFLSQYVKGK